MEGINSVTATRKAIYATGAISGIEQFNITDLLPNTIRTPLHQVLGIQLVRGCH